MKTITKRESIYTIVAITLIIILLTSDAFTSYNSYMSHVNVVKKSNETWQNINVAAVKGLINVYAPQITSTSDHRDTFVYLFYFDKFTLGAGYYAYKDNSGNIIKEELAYYWNDVSDTLYHFRHGPFCKGIPTDCDYIIARVQQVSTDSNRWKASVSNERDEHLFSVTLTAPSVTDNPSPGGVARAMYQSSSSNNLPGWIQSITIAYWENGSLVPKRIDSNVNVSDYKCASEDNWLFYLVNQFHEFKSGQGVATSDNCSYDSNARTPPGEWRANE